MRAEICLLGAGPADAGVAAVVGATESGALLLCFLAACLAAGRLREADLTVPEIGCISNALAGGSLLRSSASAKRLHTVRNSLQLVHLVPSACTELCCEGLS